jgi:hypothetical protein
MYDSPISVSNTFLRTSSTFTASSSLKRLAPAQSSPASIREPALRPGG